MIGWGSVCVVFIKAADSLHLCWYSKPQNVFYDQNIAEIVCFQCCLKFLNCTINTVCSPKQITSCGSYQLSSAVTVKSLECNLSSTVKKHVNQHCFWVVRSGALELWEYPFPNTNHSVCLIPMSPLPSATTPSLSSGEGRRAETPGGQRSRVRAAP